MPAKFVIFMVLLTSGSANPHHGHDIQISVDQKVNTGCGGDCCVDPEQNSLCKDMHGYCQKPGDHQCLGMSINNRTLNRKYCGSSCNHCCAPSGQVFTADIENALSYALRLLVPFTYNTIKDKKGNKTIQEDRILNEDSCLALKNFIRTIHKLLKTKHHIQAHTHEFIKKLYKELHHKDFICNSIYIQYLLLKIHIDSSDAFINGEWNPSVSCHNIDKGCFHLYTCGLWNILHTLTVSDDKSITPSELLKAIHGYVINFLGCSTCIDDFGTMYNQTIVEGKINVNTKDRAILWLWCVHNKVNQRKSKHGIDYEIWPPHPQFPLHSVCDWCWEDHGERNPKADYINCADIFCKDDNTCFHTPTDPDIVYYKFSKSAVLSYMKSTYGGPYSFLKTNKDYQQLNFNAFHEHCH